MNRVEQIQQLKQGLVQASIALDTVRDAIDEIQDDVLVVVAHPALMEARNEIAEALRRAETAHAHLERIMPTPPMDIEAILKEPA